MADTLLNNIFNLRFVRAFRLHTTPRWVILLIDMLIVAASFLLVSMVDLYTGPAIGVQHLLGNAAAVLGVFLVVSYLTKSYACVIRLSVIEDLNRMLWTVAIAAAVLLAGNGVATLLWGKPFMPWVALVAICVLSFTIMMVERLFIKFFYTKLVSGKQRKCVLVLGTNVESLMLANALNNENNGRFAPVGLLSVNGRKENSEVNGFKVYVHDEATTAERMADDGIEALVFSDTQSAVMRGELGDYFLRNGIALYSINKVQEFDIADAEGSEERAGISTYVKEVQIEDLLGRDPIVLNNTLVSSQIADSVVLITGACGSIGSEIVRQVAAYRARTIVLVDQAETPMHDVALEMKENYPEADVKLCIGDVQNVERMEEIFAHYKPRYVFHAAAYKHVPMMELNPTEAVLTNVQGTRNIADLALKYGAFKFVMVSTDKAVNPTNIMGCTKRLAEIYCQSLHFDAKRRGLPTRFITTRFGNVLGSNGSVIPLFRKQIAEGGPVTVTHRDITRFFMTIPEACSLVLEAGCMGDGGEIYVFDMGKSVKIYDLAVRMISLAGLKPGVDIEIKEIGLRPGEKLYEEVLNDKELTTATVNKKIMVAKVRTYEYRDVCNHLEGIVTAAHRGAVHDMVLAMKQFVPEYKSNHSEFEAIDRELEASTPSKAPTPEKYY